MPPRLTKFLLLGALIILGLAVYLDRNWLGFWKAFGAPRWSPPIHASRSSAALPHKLLESPSLVESSGEPPRPIQTQVLDPARPCFAFAVANGKKLFMKGAQPTNPDALSHLLLSSGDATPLRFEGFQRGDDQSNGRDAAYNFVHLAGTLYSFQGPPLEDDQSYLLASDAFLAVRKSLKVVSANGPIPSEIARRLEVLKGRRVQKSWAIANLGDQGAVYWVIFEPLKGQRALACMVLRSPGSLATMDVLGPEDGEQFWRVGEDTDTTGENFEILYACQTATGLEWAYEWDAEEGGALHYVIQRGTQIEEMKGAYAYRYHEPI